MIGSVSTMIALKMQQLVASTEICFQCLYSLPEIWWRRAGGGGALSVYWGWYCTQSTFKGSLKASLPSWAGVSRASTNCQLCARPQVIKRTLKSSWADGPINRYFAWNVTDDERYTHGFDTRCNSFLIGEEGSERNRVCGICLCKCERRKRDPRQSGKRDH